MNNSVLAAEMWFWRRITKTSWTARKTNDQILAEVNKKREFIQTTNSVKTKFDTTSS